MRSYTLSLTDSVRKGLANRYAGKDAVGLEQAYGYYFNGKELKPIPSYSEYPELVQNAQVFSWTPETAIAISETQVYLLRVVDGDVVPYLLTGDSFNASIPFTFVGYPDRWFAFNGEYALDGNQSTFSLYQGGVMSGCVHKGKLVLGGIDAASAGVSTLFAHYSKENMNLTFAEGSIIWSSIGTVDAFDLIFNEDMLYSPVQDDYHELIKGKLNDMLQTGEFGYMPMDSRSAVLAVLPLGNFLVVYQESAITILQSVDNEMVSTYGVVRVLPFGITSMLAVTECAGYHAFVNYDGELFTISQDGSVQKHDYSNHLGSIAIPVLTYDKVNDLVYISDDGSKSFAFKGGNLYESAVDIKDVVLLKNILLANQAGVYQYKVKSLELAFGESDFKTITNAQIVGKISSLFVRGWYSVDSGVTLPAKMIPVNPQGYAFIRCAGTSLQIELQSDDFNAIDNFKVEFQSDGKRYRRGINVN